MCVHHHTCLQKCSHAVTDIKELLNVDEHACVTAKQRVGQPKAVALTGSVVMCAQEITQPAIVYRSM